MYNVINTSFTHYPWSLRSECALYNAFDSPPSLHLRWLLETLLFSQLLLLANSGNDMAISGKKRWHTKSQYLKQNTESKFKDNEFTVCNVHLIISSMQIKQAINFKTSAILNVFPAFDNFNMIRPDWTPPFYPFFTTCFNKEYT